MKKSNNLKVFIGYDSKETIAYHTCVQSIIENTTVPVSITPLNLKMLSEFSQTQNDGSNDFIYSRFLTPYLCDFKGLAIFLDGDMIINDDLNKLIDFHNKNIAVHVVKHDYKTKFKSKYLGQKNEDYPRKNWSSVIVFNCSHKSNRILTPDVISRSKGSYLHRFSWLKDDQIGELPKTWNHLVHEYSENTKASILHYTLGVPCFEKFNYGPEALIWNNYFSKTIEGFDYNDVNKKVI